MPAFVAMVETSRLRERDDRDTLPRGWQTTRRRVLVQRQMGPRSAVVPNGVLVQYRERIEAVRLNPQGLGNAPRPAMEAAA